MSSLDVVHVPWFFFFFNDTATTEIYTLPLHDALPISAQGWRSVCLRPRRRRGRSLGGSRRRMGGHSRYFIGDSRGGLRGHSADSPRSFLERYFYHWSPGTRRRKTRSRVVTS